MMSSRKRVDILEQRLGEIERHLDKIYTALIIRDPGNRMSADAYDGLRKQVVAASGERLAHVSQLAELDVALRRGAAPEALESLASQWLNQAGVQVVQDTAHLDLFETTASPGDAVEVELPAYVDTVTNRIVKQGRLKPSSGSLPTSSSASTPIADEPTPNADSDEPAS